MVVCTKCGKQLDGNAKTINKDGKNYFVIFCLICWRKWTKIWVIENHLLGNEYWKTKSKSLDEFCNFKNKEKVKVIYT